VTRTASRQTGLVVAIDGVEVIAFADAAAWESWLAENYERHAGLWLELAKKGLGIPSVTSDEVVWRDSGVPASIVRSGGKALAQIPTGHDHARHLLSPGRRCRAAH